MTRDEISALLPFLANGTLEGDERAEIEAALAEDAALQAELRALRAIRATMQAEESFSPGEMGLARLMRGVEAEFNAVGDRLSSLRKLYGLARQAGGLGADRALDAAVTGLDQG